MTLEQLITEAEEIHMANGMLVEFCTNQLEGALTLQAESRHKLQALRKQLIAREAQSAQEVSRGAPIISVMAGGN